MASSWISGLISPKSTIKRGSECMEPSTSPSAAEPQTKDPKMAADSSVNTGATMFPKDPPGWFLTAMTELHNKIDSSTHQLESQLKAHTVTSEETRKKVDIVENAMMLMSVKLEMVNDENAQLKKQLTQLDMKYRATNLIIEGVSEQDGHDSQDLAHVKSLLSGALSLPADSLSVMGITSCSRLGRKMAGKSRPLLLSCNKMCHDFLWSKKGQLSQSKLWIREDLPEIVERGRRMLLPYLKAAHSLPEFKPTTYLRRDSLKIGNNFYSPNEIDQIPLPIRTAAAKAVIRSNETASVYFTMASPLSNYFPCKFILDDVTYISTEQAYQAKKALLFDDHVSVGRIMQETDPNEIRKIGQRLANFDEDQWKAVAEAEMYKVNSAKFTQNKALGQYLTSSGQRQLGEASPADKVWGLGMGLRHPDVLNIQKWQDNGATNLMGRILMKIRNDLNASNSNQVESGQT